jgi:hypothetical protein
MMMRAPIDRAVVYRITLKRISTGEVSLCMIVRKATEAEAWEFAEAAVQHDDDLLVAEVEAGEGAERRKHVPNSV